MTERVVQQPKCALDPGYYTDAEMFDRARDQLFHRSWQFACHASVVPEPGDRHPFSIIDQDLIVVRQKDGSLRCFYNVCQHRGHTLVKEACRKRFIVCPYHSWSYNLDGSLRNAPGTEKMPQFDRSAIRLTEVRLEIFCGFVFVNLDPATPSMSETYPGVKDAVHSCCPGIDVQSFAHEHSAPEHCNWLIALENYNECYHCRNVHPTFSSGIIDPNSYNISAAFPGAQCLRHTARAQCSETAWYDTSGSDYASFFLWPAFSLQIYPGGMVNTYHWRPVRLDETRVYRGWYSEDGKVSNDMQKVIDLDRETTFAEDLELVRNVQRGVSSKGYRPSFLVVNAEEGVNSEHSVVKLHEWAKSALLGDRNGL